MNHDWVWFESHELNHDSNHQNKIMRFYLIHLYHSLTRFKSSTMSFELNQLVSFKIFLCHVSTIYKHFHNLWYIFGAHHSHKNISKINLEDFSFMCYSLVWEKLFYVRFSKTSSSTSNSKHHWWVWYCTCDSTHKRGVNCRF